MMTTLMNTFNFIRVWLASQVKEQDNMVKMIEQKGTVNGTSQQGATYNSNNLSTSSSYTSSASSWKSKSYYSSYKSTVKTAFPNTKEYNKAYTVDRDLVVRTHELQVNYTDAQQIYEKLIPLIQDVCPDAHVSVDSDDNIYVVKGDGPLYPCFAAHSDQVHDIVDNYSLHIVDDILFAFDSYNMEQVGTGSDDKAGIYVCLEALRHLDNVKVVIFSNEEVGCLGSGKCDMSFFDDCTIVMQGDRYGNSEWITHSNGVSLCDDDFILQTLHILEHYGYHDSPNGSMTDVGELTLQNIGIVTANVAIGYKHQHCSSEVLHIPSLERAMNLMLEMAHFWSLEVARYSVPMSELMYNGYYTPYGYDNYYDIHGYETVGDAYEAELSTKYGQIETNQSAVSGFCPECYSTRS